MGNPTCYVVRASLLPDHPAPGSITKVTHPNKKYNERDVARASAGFVRPNTWFTMHIIAIANRLVVLVNDRVVADHVDKSNPLLSGKLALHQWSFEEVLFRNVTVKPLDDDKALALAQAKTEMPNLSQWW